MLISEIVNKSGLTKDAIRFYEKKGLITVARNSSPYNNYKDYSDKILKRLLIIKKFKEAGFTLKEISAFLDLIDLDSASCTSIALMVESKIHEIEKKIKALKKIKNNLKISLSNTNPDCTPSINNKNCKTIDLLSF